MTTHTENQEELIEVLNDLVRINNDRIEGYEKAVVGSKEGDKDLIGVFSKMIDESREYKADLLNVVQDLGGRVESEQTTNSGKLYRFWMDVRGAVTGNDRATVLDECEFGEDAAQKAYQQALESDATMGADVRELIMNQKSSLRTSHDTIKRLRDNQEELNRKASAINH